MDHLDEPVARHMRKDFPLLEEGLTVEGALAQLRNQGLGERIIYFYAVNKQEQLTGVIPTRRLLTSPPRTELREIMIDRVVTLPERATMLQAAEAFLQHKFMALPVVNEQRRVLGVVDVQLFTEEVYDLAERQRLDDVFQFIGLRISKLKRSSPWEAFGYRFRWVLATLASGLCCAALTSHFEPVLARTIALACFVPLILGLAESVSMQTMTVTLQRLHKTNVSWRETSAQLRAEASVALLLGVSCAALAGAVTWLWRSDARASLIIGASIFAALLLAGLFGAGVPHALHALRLDPKIAAGPITLAAVDLGTLTLYFAAASTLVP